MPNRMLWQGVSGAMLWLISVQSAQADWNALASQKLSYADNLLRAAPGAESADWSATTTLGGGAELNWQRQRWHLDVSAAHAQYIEHSERDNNSWQGALTWDWASVEGLSGNFGANRSNSLYVYTGGVDVSAPARVDQRDVSGQVRLSAGGPWALTLAGQKSATWYSLAALDAQASEQTSASVTLGRRLGSRMNLQWVNSWSATQSPRVLQDGRTPESKNRSSQLALDYTHSPRSTARLTLGRSSSTSSQGRSAPSTVGGVQLTWQPSGRTNLSLGWQRDVRNSTSTSTSTQSGSDSSGTLTQTGLINESQVRSMNLRLGWTPTGHDSLSLATSQQSTDSSTLVASSGLLSLSAARSRQLSLDWTHSLTQTTSLGCALVHEQVVQRAQGSNHPYTANTTTCTLSLHTW